MRDSLSDKKMNEMNRRKIMADYVITTDSNSDVLPEFIKENNLTVIPQYYAFGDTVYGDELNMERIIRP